LRTHTSSHPPHTQTKNSELLALAREAAFYRLPGLADHAGRTVLLPQPGARPYYDALYAETGAACWAACCCVV
jgi:hypothetical protein